ncbi:hypothetical protein EK21DRAFT_85731 [Setomelanomma holmii]|uniref:Uncharacterized protein n=1 Tax=Setomelanomma holmii TaxID=210430 RepID=A0A9P4HG11_9PLEO|nr:hypothetical protein EK21DRAFT_85731 [Setomelanomma holmii]
MREGYTVHLHLKNDRPCGGSISPGLYNTGFYFTRQAAGSGVIKIFVHFERVKSVSVQPGRISTVPFVPSPVIDLRSPNPSPELTRVPRHSLTSVPPLDSDVANEHNRPAHQHFVVSCRGEGPAIDEDSLDDSALYVYEVTQYKYVSLSRAATSNLWERLFEATVNPHHSDDLARQHEHTHAAMIDGIYGVVAPPPLLKLRWSRRCSLSNSSS